MLANHPRGFLSLFLSSSLSLSIPSPHPPPPPPALPPSLCLFFLRCMSAIHLSAVSASERYTELSLRVSLGLGGPFFAAAAAAAAAPAAHAVSLWQHRSAAAETQTQVRTHTQIHTRGGISWRRWLTDDAPFKNLSSQCYSGGIDNYYQGCYCTCFYLSI